MTDMAAVLIKPFPTRPASNSLPSKAVAGSFGAFIALRFESFAIAEGRDIDDFVGFDPRGEAISESDGVFDEATLCVPSASRVSDSFFGSEVLRVMEESEALVVRFSDDDESVRVEFRSVDFLESVTSKLWLEVFDEGFQTRKAVVMRDAASPVADTMVRIARRRLVALRARLISTLDRRSRWAD